jgi:2'-5' RNA ligase
MRLFIGIDLPPEIRLAVASASETCRRDIQRVTPRAIVRWVRPENLHITLWFLGEVADAAATELIAVLNEPFHAGAFRVRLRGLGAYPAAGNPRVIWMGIAEGREALMGVYEELNSRLPRLGFEPERRAY